MDIIDKSIRKLQDISYELDLNKQQFNKYAFTTEQLAEIFENSNLPITIDLSKLSYYTQHKFIPAPKKVGITGGLGGSRGHYKFKTMMITWYLHVLKKRGISKHDLTRKLIYNYFSDDMPPKPVDDTPIEERLIYVYRLNKRFPLRTFDLEEYNLPVIKDSETIISIPCVKVINYWNENNNLPFLSILIPKRNLTPEEHKFLLALREDKKFLKDEGIKAYKSENGKIAQKHLVDLEIFKLYPLKKKNDSKISWVDLLDKNKTYDEI
ncbi:hypothetical protein GF362_01235 [Candidatus Dojkabacteria bacterium]|nr:hypothetical protein [Candidatus Dojkabacteria bacterium]